MASMHQPEVIAIPDAETAGAIVWWRLRGSADANLLENALVGAGVAHSDTPSRPTPHEALARAMRQHQQQRVLARPLGRRKGWALVSEIPTEDGRLDYEMLCTAQIGDLGDPIVTGTPELCTSVRQAYADHWQRLSSNDVSSWLTGHLMPASQAVRLRETGGIYFVPRQRLGRFQQVAGALCGATDHVIHQVPALKSDEAVEAILDAVLREADGEISGMAEEVDGGLGKRALKTRGGRCDDLRLKVEAYEQLLGRSMEALRSRLEGLRGSIVEAVFAAEEGDEA